MTTADWPLLGRFTYDLCLTRDRAAWIERDTGEEWIVISTPDGERRLKPAWGHPGRPVFAGGSVVWTELLDGVGKAIYADGGQARPIPPFDGLDVGEISGAADTVLAEAGGRLVTARWRDHRWDLAPSVWNGRPAYRPVIGEGAAWDTYLDGRYRVMVNLFEPPGKVELLPAPDNCWESLPAVASSFNMDIFAARCRERLVDLPGGAVNHHSELVVAASTPSGWHDVATVDIDDSLNPWMAAYWGLRRFPRLVGDTDSVWLLWEEKLDPTSMSPGLGRLCAQQVHEGGLSGAPKVLLSGHCMFVVEHHATAPVIRVATKTQRQGYEWHLPYEFHQIDLHADRPERPPVEPTHATLPTSRVSFTRPDPRPAWPETPWRLYFGDPHNHSRLSCDLDGEPDELYHLARDIGALDFIAFTENDATRFTEPLTPADWERSRRLAHAFDHPGRFTALVAWEYTLHTHPRLPGSYDSHRNVLFPGRDATICSWADGTAPTPPDLVRCFHGQRVLLHHHHPQGYDITCDDLERNIEVCSGWWNCMRIPAFVERLHALLDSGLRLGFIGASDNHERNPGLGGALTGVWAEANTREGIFAALEARRVFATTGLRPELRFAVGGIPMGSEGTLEAPPELRLLVRCDTPVQAVEIIRDGALVHTWEGSETALDFAWRDDACPPGGHWYYAHLRFRDDQPDVDWSKPMPLPWNLKPVRGVDAWTSPVWITRP